MRKTLLGVALLGLCLSPVAAWAVYKPSRVVVPTWFGVTCVSPHLCLDDITRTSEAEKLYSAALAEVQSKIGAIQIAPRGIFCFTRTCAKSFGDDRPAAFNVGTVGFVINPKGMKPHFVRHEIIHHLQNERLGSLIAWTKPIWWREGMAYSLSHDPRRPIPGDGTLEAYRAKFEQWFMQIEKERLWEEAAKL